VRLISGSEIVLGEGQADRFEALVARRLNREPVSRIVGYREFWSMSFRLAPSVLDPRPDSETLVAAILDAVPDRNSPLRVLDLGTGSGCLVLALLSDLPAAQGVGVDIDPAALDVARDNARSLGLSERVKFVHGDWGAGLRPGFDVIVSNPPYIAAGDIAGLDPEVSRWDPRLALNGGDDGLDCIRALAPRIVELLAPSGMAVIEIGAGQEQSVGSVLADAGLTVRKNLRDIGGLVRCVFATVGRQ